MPSNVKKEMVWFGQIPAVFLASVGRSQPARDAKADVEFTDPA